MLAGMKASTLIEEIQRYLAAVEAFRAEGLEPNWRPEPPASKQRSVHRRQSLRTE
jgi:hypothetical protein